jgi:hypothetical protein
MTRTGFRRNQSRGWSSYLGNRRALYWNISVEKWGGKIFLNRKLRMRIYTKLRNIKELG